MDISRLLRPLQILFRGRPPRRIIVPFGEVEYSNGGWVSMPSTDRDFMVVIDSVSGALPSEIQGAFFRRFMTSKDDYVNTAKIAIDGEKRPKSTVSLQIYALNIFSDSELQNGKFELELSDESAEDIFVVEFENDVPVRVSIDD